MSEEITKSEDLKLGEYYHFFDIETGEHNIDNIIYINDFILNNWRIFTIDIPQLNTISLCKNHNGNGFIRDCSICNKVD